MDAVNHMWLDLIFPHCNLASLLCLRMVCRDFLRHLCSRDARRVWLAFTMFMERMSYAERILGWPGIPLAMERERITRKNCETGDNFVRVGPMDRIDDAWKEYIIGGRLVQCYDTHVMLHDLDNGAILADIHNVCGLHSVHARGFQDRWLISANICVLTGNHLLTLVDCVGLQVVTHHPLHINVEEFFMRFQISGSRVCVMRDTVDDSAVVIDINGITGAMATVATITRGEYQDGLIVLCERGMSYLVRDYVDSNDECDEDYLVMCIRLMDVATGQTKHMYPMDSARFHLDKPIRSNTEYVVVNASPDGIHYAKWLMRICDGRMFPHTVLPFDLHIKMDDSGALFWIDREKGLCTSNGTHPCFIWGTKDVERVRYGVCVIGKYWERHIVHCNRNALPGTEPTTKKQMK